MPDNKSISQLTTAEQLSQSDLFETSIPNGSLGYLSRKASLEAIANFIANNLNYSDLQTVAKTLIGAINEAAQSGGGASIEEMTQAQYNALTPEQKADGTLRAITDAKTSISDIDDVNITSVADGDVLAYDSTSSKWVNSKKTGSATITYNSVPFNFKRKGDFVFVSVSYSSQVQFSNGWTNIGTLPTNLMPSSSIVFCGMIFPNGNFLQMRISPSTGSVDIYPSSTNAMYPQGSTVYAI